MQRAAAMALLEARGMRPLEARNVLSSMLNRSAADRVELGQLVGSRVYQPSFEPSQERRLSTALRHPAFEQLVQWGQARQAGTVQDPTNGATHFLVAPHVMRNLERAEPSKYRSWRRWTGYDDRTGQYRNVTFQDGSHHFLRPSGTSPTQPPRPPMHPLEADAEREMIERLAAAGPHRTTPDAFGSPQAGNENVISPVAPAPSAAQPSTRSTVQPSAVQPGSPVVGDRSRFTVADTGRPLWVEQAFNRDDPRFTDSTTTGLIPPPPGPVPRAGVGLFPQFKGGLLRGLFGGGF